MNIRSYPEIVRLAYRHCLRILSQVNAYPYHNIAHTLDVTGRAERLAKSESLSLDETTDLLIAALFHDTGFTREYQKNEPIGAALAREWLEKAGHPEARIARIEGIIMATVLFSVPKTKSEEIIQDADLDNLGRNDCFLKTEAYRKELQKYTDTHDDAKFFAFTEMLLRRFRYHTASAKAERQAKIEENAIAIRSAFPDGFR